MNEQRIIDHLVHWLDLVCEEKGQKGFVVGVSGGVDSAVASALCARTDKATYCVELPIRQALDQVARAERHTRALERDFRRVRRISKDLTGVFEELSATLREGVPEGGPDELALVNTRSRLRLGALYYYAATYSCLVVGTGNKVEQQGVGFFAKYGDGGMDLSPLGDLSKTEVYALAKALRVDPAIIDAAPTDGLWDDGRTDLDQIGATYPELEWAMDLREGGADTKGMKLSKRQRRVLKIYDERHADNRHKIAEPPVAPIPFSWRDRSTVARD